ncbi:MAG: N-6 DNA methylase [Clostridia bacterium]|nr:N-6 DNA methylase [Clostridia bacterium]
MAKSNAVCAKKGHELIKAIQDFSPKHQAWEVFQDFLKLSAISISNTVDWNNAAKREKEYLETIRSYQPDEQTKLTEMLAMLIKELTHELETRGPCDVLGEVFRGLQLHNRYHGQFFTPFHICEFIGEINMTDVLLEQSRGKEYISLCEPCVGSGGMVLGAAAAMHHNKINFQQRLLVTACDIDLKCVHMAYLQLSLYGIPAIIIHGNSLTSEEWSRWYTPMYMIEGWAFKERHTISDISEAVHEKETALADSEQDFCELTEDENGQMRLF